MSKIQKVFIILVVFTLALFFVLWGLGDALLPLLLSFGAAYLVFPLIQRLERRGIHRNYAVAGVFLLSSLSFLLIMAVIVPVVIKDAQDFFQELPTNTYKAVEKIEDFAYRNGIPLDLSRENVSSFIQKHASELSSSLFSGVTTWLGKAFSSVAHSLVAVLNLFLIPLFFFYIVNDYEKILHRFQSFVPRGYQPILRDYIRIADGILSGYLRGQSLVALILCLLYALGLSIVGLKFGIVIGVLAGLLNIIPYVGFTVGFCSAIIVGLSYQASMASLLGIAAVFMIVQFLESFVITPRLVGNSVGLSSFTTVLVLIIGGNLAGLAGMLVAIPTAALCKRILKDLENYYLRLLE